jgi:putative nucleotidyltransferase with HDIG domain
LVQLLVFVGGGGGRASGLASFLVLAILPVFERFGIITDMQLLELTGLHHPLLRRLEEEAPGTWQHTLNVAKLAEAAAVEIGVNYLLVRAGCYYHDIGKMAKPEYFTENQITPEDKQRHSELKPQMSALVIKNHVKEGIEMAKAANLPERIIDFIREHHGTSVIAYFYHKALEAQARGDSKELVRIEDYRYPYLKPQTIETAIVMLADAVEATATAKLSNRSVREDDIQQVVRTTIFEKFNDGQFNECNLTLRDLEVIRETFVRVLKSRFHTRIDYPKKPTAPSRTSASRELSKEDVLPKRRAESKDPV